MIEAGEPRPLTGRDRRRRRPDAERPLAVAVAGHEDEVGDELISATGVIDAVPRGRDQAAAAARHHRPRAAEAAEAPELPEDPAVDAVGIDGRIQLADLEGDPRADRRAREELARRFGRHRGRHSLRRPVGGGAARGLGREVSGDRRHCCGGRSERERQRRREQGRRGCQCPTSSNRTGGQDTGAMSAALPPRPAPLGRA